MANLARDLGTGACNFVVASKIGHRAPIFFDVGEVRALGVVGACVKHSPPKRLRKASAVAVSGKQNRIWNCSTSCRFRPRRTGMRRSRWNASISGKTLRKPPGGNVSSTRCGKSRSFVRPVISRLRRLMQAARSILCLRQFAFPRNALMLFVCTFDAIFELAPIVRELFGDFVDPAWHMATDCGRDGHALTDVEFMRGHRAASPGFKRSVTRPVRPLLRVGDPLPSVGRGR